MNTSVGYDDAGPPPAIVPIQEPPRELPKPRRLDPECAEIINETLGTSKSFIQMSSARSHLGNSERFSNRGNPVILSPTVIDSINSTLTRH